MMFGHSLGRCCAEVMQYWRRRAAPPRAIRSDARGRSQGAHLNSLSGAFADLKPELARERA